MTSPLGPSRTLEGIVEILVSQRKELGITQAALAAEMGITQPSLARLESGGGDVKFSTLLRWAEALTLVPATTFEPRTHSIPVPYSGYTDDGTFEGSDGKIWRYYQAPSSELDLVLFLEALSKKNPGVRHIQLLTKFVERSITSPQALLDYLTKHSARVQHERFDFVGVQLVHPSPPPGKVNARICGDDDERSYVMEDSYEVGSLAAEHNLQPVGGALRVLVEQSFAARPSTWILEHCLEVTDVDVVELAQPMLSRSDRVDVSICATIGSSRMNRIRQSLGVGSAPRDLSNLQVAVSGESSLPDVIKYREGTMGLRRFEADSALVSTLPTGPSAQVGSEYFQQGDFQSFGVCSPIRPGDLSGLFVGHEDATGEPVFVDPKRGKNLNLPPTTLLVGDPATGKTTLAEALALQASLLESPIAYIDFKGDSVNEIADLIGGEIVSFDPRSPEGVDEGLDPFAWAPTPDAAAELITDFIISCVRLTSDQELELAVGLKRGSDAGARCGWEALEYVSNQEVVKIVKDQADASSAFSKVVSRKPQPRLEVPAKFVLTLQRLSLPGADIHPSEWTREQRLGMAYSQMVERFCMDALLAQGGGLLVVDGAWPHQVDALLRDQARAVRCPRVHVVFIGYDLNGTRASSPWGSIAAFRMMQNSSITAVLEAMGAPVTDAAISEIRNLKHDEVVLWASGSAPGKVNTFVAPEVLEAGERAQQSVRGRPAPCNDLPWARPVVSGAEAADARSGEEPSEAEPTYETISIPPVGSRVDVTVAGNLLSGRLLVAQRLVRSAGNEVIPGAVELELQTSYGTTEIIPFQRVEKIFPV